MPRLFFALWPDEAVRVKLHARAKQLLAGHRCHPVTPDNFHLTLYFMGDIPPDQVLCATHVAESIRGQPFSLTLDGAGFFARPRVVWLGCRFVPQALQALAGALNEQLKICNLAGEKHVYVPHMTIARKAHAPVVTAIDPVSWAVDAFTMVRSREAPEKGYEVIGRWPLKP